MSKSNYDKPFYVDIGTSIVAIRCASNHDVIFRSDYSKCPPIIKMTEDVCDRMNREVEIVKPLRNCDIGTAEEQAERFRKFCNAHTHQYGKNFECYKNCPARNYINGWGIPYCQLKWAQMPYEEEASND